MIKEDELRVQGPVGGSIRTLDNLVERMIETRKQLHEHLQAVYGPQPVATRDTAEVDKRPEHALGALEHSVLMLHNQADLFLADVYSFIQRPV